MTIQSKLAQLIAAGVLVSSVAAHAQTAAAPNIAPSTVEEESTLPGTAANVPQLAMDRDPDLAPSSAGEQAQRPATSANSPQLAVAPDPDIAPSDDMAGQ